jgi:hypothetical protein
MTPEEQLEQQAQAVEALRTIADSVLSRALMAVNQAPMSPDVNRDAQAAGDAARQVLEGFDNMLFAMSNILTD